jgi:ParB-like chromosome segregation protein Spo0J
MRDIELKRIDISSPFLFSRVNELPEKFLSSVKEYGILTPLYGYFPEGGDEGTFVPLTGKKRILAAVELNLAEIPVRVFEADSDYERWIFAVNEYLSGSSATELEISHILHYTYFSAPEREWRKLFGLLNIYPDSKRLKLYRNLYALDDEIKNYFSRYNFSFNQLETALSFSGEILQYTSRLADKLSIRPVEFLEIGNSLHDLCRRAGRSVRETVENLGLEIILASDFNRNQKIQKIRIKLKEAHYPTLSAINGQISRLSEKLPKKIKAEWDRSLERGDLSVRIKLSRNNSIPEQLKELTDNEVISILEEIQKILLK